MEQMDPLQLKEATRADHERVEAGMRLMSDDLDREEYVRTLRKLYGAIKAWEDFARVAAPADLRSFVDQRQRSQWIAADLATMGSDLPAGRPLVNDFADKAAFLGAMYVIEGSTLGGQYIARCVEQSLHLKNGEGNRYFLGYGERTGQMWQEFRQVIQTVPDEDAERVIHSAQRMFAIFEDWMKSAA